MSRKRIVQLFCAAEGVIFAGVGAVIRSPMTVIVGVLLTGWGLYGMLGRGELVTFITGDRDERQRSALDTGYRFGFTAATLWVAAVAVAFGSSGAIPIGWVAAANMAGLVGLVAGYWWHLRRT